MSCHTMLQQWMQQAISLEAWVCGFARRALRKNGSIDLDDQLGLAVGLLKRHPVVRDSLRSRFAHVIVGE